MNYIKIILTIFFITCLSAFSYSADMKQEISQKFVINLKNGKLMQIQVCSASVFRVRIQSTTEFKPSLMERYGIISTEWKPAHAKAKLEGDNRIIETEKYRLLVNENSGLISVLDLSGKVIIDRVMAADPGSAIITKIGESLTTYFGLLKSGGGIIGESNYTGEKKLEKELVDSSQNSLIGFSLKNEERFYGGGSINRKNIQHRGEALRMWAAYQKAEMPVPFIMSSNGWGVFNNTTSRNYFDIGRFDKDTLYLCNTDGSVDFYLMLGNSMNDILYSYTAITGRSYMLPKWAYGFSFGGNKMEDQIDLLNAAVKFREEKIPTDMLWVEPQWMSSNYDFSTSKNWDSSKFPAEPFWEANNQKKKYKHPSLFINRLHGLGFKLALWLCIDHDMSIAAEDQIASVTGKPQSGLEHWFPHLTKFIDQGVDGFKLDPGLTLNEHPDRKYYNGLTDNEMHNLNQVLLQKQMNETFRNHKGIRGFQHYCGGYAGSQKWGASTSGDNGGAQVALYDQLNLGLSGFMNHSADILEFVDNNKDGIHFGFFLPWVQLNSWYNLHHPWYMMPSEKELFKKYAQLRNSLSLYIYSTALYGHQTGMPILRAMPLAFPNDRKVDNMINQYMFGESFLVGVFSDSIYLPEGNWINFWNGKKYKGNQTISSDDELNNGALLFVRAGSIIPFLQPADYIEAQDLSKVTLNVYPDASSTYTLYEDDGISYDYENGKIATTEFECVKSDSRIQLTINPTSGTYDGMPTLRSYTIKMAVDKKPTQVLLNGNPIIGWNYDEFGIATINLASEIITHKQILEIR